MALPDSFCVYLVDDDEEFRQSLEDLLNLCGLRVRSFASAREFLSEHQDEVGCLVLDMHMPEMSGLDLQSRLVGDEATMPIVFLSGACSIPATVKAIKSGAEDFLTKPVELDTLLEAIERAVLRSAQQRTQAIERTALEQRFASLTLREVEVCRLLARGLLNKQVAFELGTTERTIKAHRQRLMGKLEVTSMVELMSRYRTWIED